MKIEQIPIESLIPYAKNARTHSGEQVAQIILSIKEFGFNNPVLIDEVGGIIAGHGRVMAAKKMNLAEVPCIRLSHLSENQKRAFILADNKLALNAGWNDSILADELRDIQASGFDLSPVGFNADELGKILEDKALELDSKSATDASKKQAYCCPKCGFKFEVEE